MGFGWRCGKLSRTWAQGSGWGYANSHVLGTGLLDEVTLIHTYWAQGMDGLRQIPMYLARGLNGYCGKFTRTAQVPEQGTLIHTYCVRFLGGVTAIHTYWAQGMDGLRQIPMYLARGLNGYCGKFTRTAQVPEQGTLIHTYCVRFLGGVTAIHTYWAQGSSRTVCATR